MYWILKEYIFESLYPSNRFYWNHSCVSSPEITNSTLLSSRLRGTIGKRRKTLPVAIWQKKGNHLAYKFLCGVGLYLYLVTIVARFWPDFMRCFKCLNASVDFSSLCFRPYNLPYVNSKLLQLSRENFKWLLDRKNTVRDLLLLFFHYCYTCALRTRKRWELFY